MKILKLILVLWVLLLLILAAKECRQIILNEKSKTKQLCKTCKITSKITTPFGKAF
jgi:hypothetical protein